MAIDVKGLVQDKRVQIAAGAGAVLGLVALIRKRGSSDIAEAESNDVAGVRQYAGGGAAGGGYLGGYDSTATDVYNNLQTSLDNQLEEFRKQLTGFDSELDALKPRTPPTTPKPTTPKPPGIKPPVKPKPPISKPKPAAKPTIISIPRGSTLSGLAAKYKTTVPSLMKLNPSIKNPNRITAGAKLRVK